MAPMKEPEDEPGGAAAEPVEDADDEIAFFAPVRLDVVQALRPGDELLVPTTDGDPFPRGRD
jgi:hypothetical protein